MVVVRKILLISLMNTLPVTTIRSDYTPYTNAIEGEIAQLLDNVRVSGVTAIYYHCAPHYSMEERRIGDDMFYYIVKGKGEVRIEGRSTPVRAGDCAHFRRGVLHAATTDARDPFDVIAVHYDAVVFGSLTLPQLLDFPDVFKVGTGSPFEEMLSIACREFALRPIGWELGLEALATRMLLYLMRTHGDCMNASLHTAHRRELERVLPALEYLRNHLDEPLCVADLARVCHLSEPQFRRVFRAALNTSPSEYSRRLRMEEAALLLRRTNHTIDAVAARVGYSDPSFFAQSFKAAMGASPGKYRTMESV